MENAQALTIVEADWPDVAELIGQAVQHASVADVRAQWASGCAHAFAVMDGAGQRVAAFVLRVDELADGPEGVILAASGGMEGVSLTHTVLPAIEQILNSCRSVRIHTARPGLVKLLTARHGYRLSECVLRKEFA